MMTDPMTSPQPDTWTWPFAVGDTVKPRGNWGPLVCGLRVNSERDPSATYVVHEVADGGRWLSLRGSDGHVYGGTAGYGHTYFRIAGECGTHVRAYGSALGWHCARCDLPLEEPKR